MHLNSFGCGMVGAYSNGTKKGSFDPKRIYEIAIFDLVPLPLKSEEEVKEEVVWVKKSAKSIINITILGNNI